MMNLFQKYLAEEYIEDYQEGRLSRRSVLKLIAAVTGSMLTANSLLAACASPEETQTAQSTLETTPPPTPTVTQAPATPTSAPTATGVSTPQATTQPTDPPGTQPQFEIQGTVSPNDPAVIGEDYEFPGDDGSNLLGYLARPSDIGSYPVVLVCHENRGLTNHIKDVARRLAKAGYIGLAVDLLARQGGTAALSPDAVPGFLGNTPPGQFVQDFKDGWLSLHDQPFAEISRLGMVGFCFGGGVTWQAAVNMPELLAAVPFYGPHPMVEDVPAIQAAILAIYGANDARINQGIAAIEAAMQANAKIYEKIIYPGADHAFHNDTGSRYHPAAAMDAWDKTLAWFGHYLKT
jgi:carboxymethylenebutenolidase